MEPSLKCFNWLAPKRSGPWLISEGPFGAVPLRRGPLGRSVPEGEAAAGLRGGEAGCHGLHVPAALRPVAVPPPPPDPHMIAAGGCGAGMGHRDRMFKVLVVGDATVGKTSLVQRYANDSFNRHYKSTVGVDFALKVVQWSESETVRLQLWDIAGQERFTSMTRLYYREASACIIMFDVTNVSTFGNSQKWKQDLDSKLTLPDGNPVPCLLLANKCDLSPWAVTREEVDRFSKENGFSGWVETSVKENKNINESMRVLIEKMMSSSTRDGSSSAPGSGDYINIKESSPPGWACC